MRCTAKQAQARNQGSLHAIRAGEGGREFRQLPPFERFAAYRRATTKSGVVQCKICAEPVSVVGSRAVDPPPWTKQQPSDRLTLRCGPALRTSDRCPLSAKALNRCRDSRCAGCPIEGW